MTRAVVIGGSIAGMCSARVLCDFFDEVVLLDRDHYPTQAAARAGVPQSRHAHALLERGRQELETLFPGFLELMRAGGALSFDAGDGFAMRRAPGWQDVGANGFEALWSSRDLLEWSVRQLMQRDTKVQLREGVQVIGLRGGRTDSGTAPALRGGASSAARVTGVRLRSDGAGEQELGADLVVDASGRNTHVDEWLQALNLVLPDAQRVDAHAGYASRFYKMPPLERRPADWWWKGLWVEWQPDLPRGGVIFPIEGDRFLLSTVGIAPDQPPTEEQAFLRFLERLSSPAIARAVALCEPISPIAGNRAMANVFRRYDRWQAELHGFVALGDSVCAFNPIYGQGMSTASACAGILHDVLRTRGARPGFERVFWQRQAQFLGEVWNLATGADFIFPTTEGERPKVPKPLSLYLNLALRAAHEDAALRSHIAPVFNLVGPMRLFFTPEFVGKVLVHAGRSRVRERLLGAASIPDLPPKP